MLIDKICNKCSFVFEVLEGNMDKCLNKKHKCPKCGSLSKHKRTFINSSSNIKVFGKVVPGYEKNAAGVEGTSFGAKLDAYRNKWY